MEFDKHDETMHRLFGKKDTTWLLFFHEDNYAVYGQKHKGAIDILGARTTKVPMDKFKSFLEREIKVLKNSFGVEIKTKKIADDYSSTVYGTISGSSQTSYVCEYEIKSRYDAYSSALAHLIHLGKIVSNTHIEELKENLCEFWNTELINEKSSN